MAHLTVSSSMTTLPAAPGPAPPSMCLANQYDVNAVMRTLFWPGRPELLHMFPPWIAFCFFVFSGLLSFRCDFFLVTVLTLPRQNYCSDLKHTVLRFLSWPEPGILLGGEIDDTTYLILKVVWPLHMCHGSWPPSSRQSRLSFASGLSRRLMYPHSL